MKKILIPSIHLLFVLFIMSCSTNNQNESASKEKETDTSVSDTVMNDSNSSVITCPYCGFEKRELLPTEYCLIRYTCTKCEKEMTPYEEDCCVFCSYGTHKCPSMQEETDTNESRPDTVSISQLDVSSWELKDFVISSELKDLSEVYDMVEYLKEEFTKLDNPAVLTFEGHEFGDYFHLLFTDENGNTYAFGDGDNNLEDYELYKDADMPEDNPLFLNQKFLVYWDWKVSNYPCCSGGYNNVEGYVPSIVKLQLLPS